MNHKLLLGVEFSNLNVNLDFLDVYNNCNDSIVQRFDIEDWKYKPSHNPTAASYYLISRFGKINFYSHSLLDPTTIGKFQSRFTNFGYGYQFKRLILNFTYRRVKGFIRSNDGFNPPNDTLPNMIHRDFRASVEFINLHSSNYSRYGYSQLYIPVRAYGFLNTKIETAFIQVMDKGGVIPFFPSYYYNSTAQNWMIDLSNEYMQKFQLYIQSFSFNCGGIVPILKQKGERPKSFCFRGSMYWGFNFFNYNVNNASTTIERSKLKVRAMGNLQLHGSLFYADRFLTTGINASYNGYECSIVYPYPVLSVKYFYTSLTAYLAFRIPFTKGYATISNIENKRSIE